MDEKDLVINDQQPRQNDDESESEKALFTPPLSIQRYQRVSDLATKYQIKSILDLGCGECRLIQRVKNVVSLEQITGVDIEKTPLMMSKLRCRPLMSDHLCPRSRPLVIELYHGDITTLDKRIADHEMISLVEVVEHLLEKELAKLPETVFGTLRPNYCVVTTPNSEYNVLFENFKGMRHWDHKFEWNRHDFEEWANSIASKYGYSVQFDGVGDPPPDRIDVGFCTQIAIFKRINDPTSEPITEENYTLICRENYPYRTEVQKLREKVCQELERIIPELTEDDKLNKISLDSLYKNSILDSLCERKNLVAMLRVVGYELTKDEEYLIIDRREEWDSDDDDNSGGQFSDADDDESLEILFDNWKSIEFEVWD